MPNLTFPKSALEPRAQLPAGIVTVIFEGFKPKLSKNKEKPSVNLNPQLKIVNDSRVDASGKSLNGQKVFDSLNLSFLPRLQDFVHAFGEELVENGDNVDLPGYFDGDTSNADPAQWGQYHGPLLGRQAQLELVEVPSRKPGAKPTDTQVDIKRYICSVPGCGTRHMESLIQS